MNRRAGKTAIVTGGRLGIGRACVIRSADAGARVAIFDRDDAAGRTLAGELSARGHAAVFWALDVADEAALTLAIDAAAARFGGLPVRVTTAGIPGSPKPTDKVAEAERDLVQGVNVTGVFFGTEQAFPHVRAAGRGSRAAVRLASDEAKVVPGTDIVPDARSTVH